MARSPIVRLPVLALLFGLSFAACQATNQVADFANNDAFYVDVPFVTKAPGDRGVFVAPVVDTRDFTRLPTQDKGFPITYGADDFWERPVGEMLGDVLQRQIEESRLFAEIAATAGPGDVVVQPTLVTFVAGATEAMFGSSSFAEVGLRLVVLGPARADGERPLWHDRVYASRQSSPIEVNPVHPFRLVGRALQVTMQKGLAGLDGSNVGRSGAPVAGAPVVPAVAPVREASASPGR